MSDVVLPSTGRRATPLPPDQRRAAIIDAVLPLLVEHGDALTTRQIAVAAGVAEGTIFNVFDDKDALVDAALDAALATEPYERVIEAIDPDLSFEERLAQAVVLTQRRVVDIWRLVSRLGHRHVRPHAPLPVSPALTALFDSERDRIRLEPADAAQLLRALTLSLTHPQLAEVPLPADRIVDLVLHGIGTGR